MNTSPSNLRALLTPGSDGEIKTGANLTLTIAVAALLLASTLQTCCAMIIDEMRRPK